MLKTENFSMRIKPEVREALRQLCEQTQRSAAAELEFLVRRECKKLGVPVKSSREASQ
jgi:hypothetical protein